MGFAAKWQSLQLLEVLLSQSGEVLSEIGRNRKASTAVSALPFLQGKSHAIHGRPAEY
jgi:hypothetical protein